MAKEQSDRAYFRFNVQQGLQKIELADWERLGEVETHTVAYMRLAEVDRNLDKVVSIIGDRKSSAAENADAVRNLR